MSKFKVGEKIAVYTNRSRMIGYIDAIEVSSNSVRIGTNTNWFHPKQCRRLKPKAKPREWEVLVRYKKGRGYFSIIKGTQSPATGESFTVREVRKKPDPKGVKE